MKKLICYSAGAIERSPDLGVGWRQKLDIILQKLGIIHYNPTELENIKLKEFHPNRLPKKITTRSGRSFAPKHWHQLSLTNMKRIRDRFNRMMRSVIDYDLKLVKKSDFVIVLVDKYMLKGSGTFIEMHETFMQKKPVYAVVKVERIPSWLTAYITKEFKSFDELHDFLDKKYIR